MFPSLSSLHMLLLLIATAAALGVALGRWSRWIALRRMEARSAHCDERLADVRMRLEELRAAFVRISDALEIAAERERSLTQEVGYLRRCLLQAEAERDRALPATRQLGLSSLPEAPDWQSAFPAAAEPDRPAHFLGRGASPV